MGDAPLSLEELREEVARGTIDTVRVCFSDHYGMLRGRRLVGEVYAADPEAVQAFCDGALVWDVHCDIFEEADYSNFGTGYPDLLAFPDLGSLRRCGWSEGSALVLTRVTDPHGERSPLDPRGILAQASEQTGAGPAGTSLSLRAGLGELAPGWKPEPAPAFVETWRTGLERSGLPVERLDYDPDSCRATLALAPMEPVTAADALVTARSAAREIGLVEGFTVTTMGRLGSGAGDETLLVRPEGSFPENDGALGRLGDLGLLCRPLPLAWPGAGLTDGGSVVASASANPYLALAATVIAAGAHEQEGPPAPPGSYVEAIERFAEADWAVDWLGGMFVHDTLAIAHREAGLREEGAGPSPAATAWDVPRYGEVG